jgi:hypothetical protein
MKSVGKMTQSELGAFVQSQLREKGIEVILSDGAPVTSYSNKPLRALPKAIPFYATPVIRNRTWLFKVLTKSGK